MKRKLEHSMGIILCIALILCCAFFGVILYFNNLSLIQNEVEKEAYMLKEAIDYGDSAYLDTVENYIQDSRLTLINSEGVVLFDTEEDPSIMDNHGERVEIIEAFETGSGEVIRHSDTIGTSTYYFAVLLDSGSIIRVSKTVNSIILTLVKVLPFIVFMGVALWFIVMFIAKKLTERMIEPLNNLDVENPLDAEVYEELRPLLERIDSSNKAKEEVTNMRKEFTANVSHELKTPLTSISGYAELLQNGMVRPNDISRFAGKIYGEATTLIMLVEDIIKLSRLDEGRIELEKEEVDLYYMVKDIVGRVSYSAQKKNVQITVSGQSVKYRGIRQIIDEMLYNICDNGIKYNKENGKIEIWVGATIEGPKIIVRDTGIGIPLEFQDRVFERFYRVDKSHSKATGGTGLGLSIVKNGAKLHKADISLESEVGVGTKIEVLFNK